MGSNTQPPCHTATSPTTQLSRTLLSALHPSPPRSISGSRASVRSGPCSQENPPPLHSPWRASLGDHSSSLRSPLCRALEQTRRQGCCDRVVRHRGELGIHCALHGRLHLRLAWLVFAVAAAPGNCLAFGIQRQSYAHQRNAQGEGGGQSQEGSRQVQVD